jgi:Na+/serine symporter
MTKNPFINAFSALLYILVVATVMNSMMQTQKGPDTIVAPILILSMFTLSAAVMGFLFLSNPLQLYLDGKKKNAVTLFLQTVGVFAVSTAIILGLVLTKVLH